MKKVARSQGFSHIQTLRSAYLTNSSLDPEDLPFFDKQEQELRLAIEQAQISEIPVVKEMIKESEEIILTIDQTLRYKVDLSEKERAALMGERDAHEFYLGRLSAERALATRKAIEDALARMVQKLPKK